MLQFTEDCRLGIPEIDSEHERLFALVNKGSQTNSFTPLWKTYWTIWPAGFLVIFWAAIS